MRNDEIPDRGPALPDAVTALCAWVRVGGRPDRTAPWRLERYPAMGNPGAAWIERADLERPPRANDPDRARSRLFEAARIIGARHGRSLYEDLRWIRRRWPDASDAAVAAAAPLLDAVGREAMRALGIRAYDSVAAAAGKCCEFRVR